MIQPDGLSKAYSLLTPLIPTTPPCVPAPVSLLPYPAPLLSAHDKALYMLIHMSFTEVWEV
jgi:hypothetical protein